MIALTLALFVGASMAAFVLAVARAPLGYEDEATGFHFGDEPGRDSTDSRRLVAPVILSHDATNSPGRRHDHA
jgi:hypothetical protein